MNKSKVLNILVILLIVINLVALGFFLIGNKKNIIQKRENPQDIIIKKLQLDSEQIEQYKLLMIEHHEQLKKHSSEIRQLKNNLFLALTDSTANSDSLILHINASQLNIERAHYTHFKSIRDLCKPSQMKAFEELSKKLGRLFAPPRRERGKERIR